jgi:cytochrome c oxidase cbb3-type subunit 3
MKTMLVVLLLVASVAAQQPQGGGRGLGIGLISRPAPDPAAVDRGQKVFAGACGFCHGPNANGGESGADLIRSPLALNDEGGDKIGPVIRQGRPAAGMPAFPQMTDEQIKDIAAFLRARQQAAINRGSYKLLELNTGDAKKGEAFFASHCAGCHQPDKDLAHIASKYETSVLISRMLYPGGRGGRGGRGGAGRGGGGRGAANNTPATVTVTLPDGQKYSGHLEYLDDFDVSLRDDAGQIHTFARAANVRVEVSDPLKAHAELLKNYTDAEWHNVLAYLETLK